MEQLIPDLQVINESPTHCLIGSPSRKTYIKTPTIAGEICNRLLLGESIEQIDKNLKKRSVSVNIYQFIEQLREIQLWRTFDDGEVTNDRKSLPWFAKLGRIIFSPVMMVIYAVLFLLGTGMAIKFYSTNNMGVSLLDNLGIAFVVFLLADFALTSLHECAHIVGASAYGVSAQIRWGRRLFFPVLQTQMNGLYGVPRSQRWIPILAGMALDSLILFVAAVFLTWGSPAYRAIFLWLSVRQMLFLMWECLFFLRTDIYYLIIMTTGIYNLHQKALEWLESILKFKWREDLKTSRVVKVYSILYIVGAAFIIGFFGIECIKYVWPTFRLAFTRIIAYPLSVSSFGSWAFIILVFFWAGGISWSMLSSKFRDRQEKSKKAIN